MILTWPSELPRPERNSWQSAPQEARRKTQSDVGPVRWRRRFSSVARSISLSVILTRDLRAVFDRFYDDDCAHGSRLFWMPDPTTDGWPMLTGDGDELLLPDGSPVLLSARWLCSWGDQLPTETIHGQVEFKKSFNITVLP